MEDNELAGAGGRYGNYLDLQELFGVSGNYQELVEIIGSWLELWELLGDGGS